MMLYNPDAEEPTVAEQMLDCVPEGTSYAAVLETFSALIASIIISAAERDLVVKERLLQVVQSDIREKVSGRAH